MSFDVRVIRCLLYEYYRAECRTIPCSDRLNVSKKMRAGLRGSGRNLTRNKSFHYNSERVTGRDILELCFLNFSVSSDFRQDDNPIQNKYDNIVASSSDNTKTKGFMVLLSQRSSLSIERCSKNQTGRISWSITQKPSNRCHTCSEQ